jgi:hypothetical protein
MALQTLTQSANARCGHAPQHTTAQLQHSTHLACSMTSGAIGLCIRRTQEPTKLFTAQP